MGEDIKKQTLRSVFLFTYRGLSYAFVLCGCGSLLFCSRLKVPAVRDYAL